MKPEFEKFLPLYFAHREEILANEEQRTLIVDTIKYGGLGGCCQFNIPLGLLIQSWENPKMQCVCPQCGGTMYLYGLQLHANQGSIISGSAYCPNCGSMHGINGNPNDVKASEFIMLMRELCGSTEHVDLDKWNRSLRKKYNKCN